MEIQTTLVGANFRPAESRDYVKNLAVGDDLFLESDNPFDAKVIANIESDDGETEILHLGYVARTDNAALANALGEGEIFSCEVTGFTPTLLIKHIPADA